MRYVLALLAASSLWAQALWIRSVPDQVWKAPEAARGYEGWALDLVVGPSAHNTCKPVALEITLKAKGK